MRRGTGITLIEIVVCLSLFSIVLLVLTALFGHTFRYVRAEEEPARIKQRARLTLENIGDDIRKAQAVRRPANYFDLVWQDNHQIELQLTPERSHHYELTGDQINRHVELVAGAPGQDAVTQMWTQKMCDNVQRLWLRVEDVRAPSLITVEIEVQAGKSAVLYRTKINFRSMVQVPGQESAPQTSLDERLFAWLSWELPDSKLVSCAHGR
ncbi:MAG: prepilin-type N-terminal cleavage/methylation domain-containing protein [Armatimonadetes bacterium]|nr:prepilin-type N-terminal cleavage/methylation domain-containing protein [Armatimonadota bacterium]